MNENCRWAEAGSGYYVRVRQPGYFQIELFSVNTNRSPAILSEGLWWMLESDGERFRH